MICLKCGAENRDNSILCSKCGAQLRRSKGVATGRGAKQQVAERTAILAKGEIISDTRKGSPGITLCPDGIYRWVCEINRFHLGEIIQSLIPFGWLPAFLIWCCKDQYSVINSCALMQVFFFIAFIVTGLLPFFVVLAVVRRRFLYEMNDEGITCIKFDCRASKHGVMKAMASFVDPADSFKTVAAEILEYAGKNFSFSFSTVQSISSDVKPRGHAVIFVEDCMGVKEVYTEKEDFDFVLDFIKNHVSAEAAGDI
ncbi:MAG: zinc ribbon domain-containing protein [bacterium]|nr:zinc ribbon domain-containing protein [bacterium]